VAEIEPGGVELVGGGFDQVGNFHFGSLSVPALYNKAVLLVPAFYAVADAGGRILLGLVNMSSNDLTRTSKARAGNV